MSATLEKQLKTVRKKEGELLRKIEIDKSNKAIRCASCSKSHRIKNLTAIQTHWYDSPRGHTEGDNWYEGELQFVCPATKVRNRLLFDNTDIPWEKRTEYENDPEQQFKEKYRHLFAEVLDEHTKQAEEFVNNYFVDKNRASFGLVERKK